MHVLHKDENIEDLQLAGIRIIQSTNGFHFGEDAVILSNYVVKAILNKKASNGLAYDMGSNSGVISLILAGKLPGLHIVGIEAVTEASNIFHRNIMLNGFENRISCINANWNNLSGICPAAKADLVISNPPYAYRNDHENSSVNDIRIAREEILSDVTGVVKAISYLLKPGGNAYLIYRSNRLTDVLTSLRNARLEPTTIVFIHPFAERAPNSFIVTARKHGKPSGIRIEKPIVIFKAIGEYTDEVIHMYGKTPAMSFEELHRNIYVD